MSEDRGEIAEEGNVYVGAGTKCSFQDGVDEGNEVTVEQFPFSQSQTGEQTRE